MEEKEIWKDISGYEGLYQVSNLGRIKRLRRFIKKRLFKSCFIEPIFDYNDLYIKLIIGHGQKRKRNIFLLRDLVANAFLKNNGLFDCVINIDGNIYNNNLSNLKLSIFERKEKLPKINLKDKFKYLEVIKYVGIEKNQARYLCKCSCGVEKVFSASAILTKTTLNCGCQDYDTLGHKNRKFTPQEASLRIYYSHYKSSAKNRGLEIKLTTEEAIKFFQENCFYCGDPPSLLIGSRDYRKYTRIDKKVYPDLSEFNIFVNGIDRIDSNKDYVLDNCVTCCKLCNYMKRDYPLDKFLCKVDKIYNHSILNKK